MGMDLSCREPYEGVDNACHFNMSGWGWILDKSVSNGWKCPGTKPPLEWNSPEQWDGNYTSNDQQFVTPEDASDWTDALEKGKPYDNESPYWRDKVDEFIAYCRGGGFEIW